MKHKLFIQAAVALIIIIITTTASAQGRLLTLKEAIQLSVQNSHQLRLNYAKVEEASAAYREALERRLPQASITASHIRLSNPNIDLKTKPANGGGTQQQANPSSATYAIANVSLPLYAGSRINYGIESSKYLEQAAKLDADNNREQVVLNTISAYDNLFKASAAVGVIKETVASTAQRVKDFTNLETNGLMARNDLLKAELQQSNAELSLLDAENNLRLANVNMDLMLGLPDTTTLTVNDADLLITSIDLKPVDVYIQQALQSRKDIAAMALRKKAASTGVKSVHAEAYPSIALTGGYIAADVPNLLTVTNAVNIGIGLQYNISSLWTHGKLDQAKAREKQVTENQEMLNEAVTLQIHKAYEDYLLSTKKIEVYQKSVQQAEENYRIINNKFTNALATTTELLDADVAQSQARLNAAVAKSDAAVAYSRLLQSAGLLYNDTNSK